MDMDAYSVVVELLAQAHGYGESIADKMELWISISSGLIVMAYFAPDRLNKTVASVILFAYITFSVFVVTNSAADARLGDQVLVDAQNIADANNLNSAALSHRINDASTSRGSQISGLIFLIVLFAGTIGYLLFTAYQTHNRQKTNVSPK